MVPSVGPTGGRIHGADEYVDIDSLIEVAQIVALTAVDWCETVRGRVRPMTGASTPLV